MKYHNIRYDPVPDASPLALSNDTRAYAPTELTTTQLFSMMLEYADESAESCTSVVSAFAEVFATILDIDDVDVNQSARYPITDADIYDSIRGAITQLSNFADDKGDLTITAGPISVILKIKVDNNNATISTYVPSTGTDLPYIVCTKLVNGAIRPTLIYNAENLFHAYTGNHITPVDLQSSISALAKNSIIYEIIATVCELYIRGDLSVASFTAMVQARIPSLEGDALTIYQSVLPLISSKDYGRLVLMMKSIVTDTQNIQDNSGQLTFTSNATFGFKSCLAGVLSGSANTIALVASTVATIVSPIAGAIIATISLIGNAVVSLIGAGYDSLTDVKLNLQSDDRLFPVAFFQSNGQLTFNEARCHSNFLGERYCWNDASSTGNEFFLRATFTCSKTQWQTILSTLQIVDNNDGFVSIENWSREDFIRTIRGNVTVDDPAYSLAGKPSKSVDEALRYRFALGLFFLITCIIPWSYNGSSIRFKIQGSIIYVWRQLMIDINRMFNTDMLPPAWSELLDRASWANFFSVKDFDLTNYFDPSTLTQDQINDFPSLMTSAMTGFTPLNVNTIPTVDLPVFIKSANFIQLPKYTEADVILTTLLAVVVTAASVTAVAIGVTKVRKMINTSIAKRAAKLESLWQAYLTNPTSTNYAAYQKAAKRNNFLSKLFGGSQYSIQGFWASGEDAALAPVASTLMKSVENLSASDDLVAKVDAIAQRIG